jgi:hypothetical protein
VKDYQEKLEKALDFMRKCKVPSHNAVLRTGGETYHYINGKWVKQTDKGSGL